MLTDDTKWTFLQTEVDTFGRRQRTRFCLSDLNAKPSPFLFGRRLAHQLQHCKSEHCEWNQGWTIDQFTTRHQVVHNGGSPNFEKLLFDKKTTCIALILRNLSYKVCSITLPKFNKFGLFILILGTAAIMDQTACCYNVTTLETGLYEDDPAGLVLKLYNECGSLHPKERGLTRCRMKQNMIERRKLILKPVLGQKPPGHKPPDKTPLDKNPLCQKPPCQKPPVQKPPTQNILFRNFITFVFRMSHRYRWKSNRYSNNVGNRKSVGR